MAVRGDYRFNQGSVISQFKKLLVIGGLHGKEPLGVDVVQQLQQHPRASLDAMIGNQEAVAAGTRFVDDDINRIFPGQPDGNKEERLAYEITELGQKYDLVIDIHNTPSPGSDCVFVGPDFRPELLKVATALGFNRAIVATYGCINKALRHCISLEISLSSPLMDAVGLATNIRNLDISHTPQSIEMYQFYRRISFDDKESLGLADWHNFQPIPREDALALGSPESLYPVFVGKTFETNFYAVLVQRFS